MKYQIVRDLPFPVRLTPKNIEDAMDYVAHDGDIIISSYMKTGTNWLTYIALQIISKGETFPSFHASSMLAPNMEMVGKNTLDQMPQPRIYRTHIPYDMMKLKENTKAKILYIYRKPDDACISYYHYSKSVFPDWKDKDEFFEAFLSGNVVGGHYFNNLLSHLKCKDDPNLMMISYENLLQNTKEVILLIAEFLGKEYHQMLLEDETLLNHILERTSFDFMKKNLFVAHPEHKEEWVKGVTSEIEFRKGVVGDGRSAFTLDQLERLKIVAKQMLKDYDFLLKQWFDE